MYWFLRCKHFQNPESVKNTNEKIVYFFLNSLQKTFIRERRLFNFYLVRNLCKPIKLNKFFKKLKKKYV